MALRIRLERSSALLLTTVCGLIGVAAAVPGGPAPAAAAVRACGTIVGPTGARLPVQRAGQAGVSCTTARRVASVFLPRHGRAKQAFRMAGRRWWCSDTHGAVLEQTGMIASCSDQRRKIQIRIFEPAS